MCPRGVRTGLGASPLAVACRCSGGLGAYDGLPARGEPLAPDETRPAQPGPGPRGADHRATLSETHVALVAALRELPEAQRRAIVLHHLADLPVEAVARELGAPVGTIKARLSRGRTALAALLGDRIPEEGITRA